MSKKAILYRMMTKNHHCPYGIKSKYLLEKQGYEIEDNYLKTKEEAEEFKKQHDVKTTPQTFIDGKRVGGYDDLREFFGKKKKQTNQKTYQPVIAVFLVTFLIAIALNINFFSTLDFFYLIKFFVAFSMSVLAILKLRDLFSFSNQFITYDLLARKWVPYAYVYAFAEAFAGIGMLVDQLKYLVIPVAFFIGLEGAISVYKAVYIDKRDLKCACVGGNSNVPLGFISLTENLMMMIMATWMLLKNI